MKLSELIKMPSAFLPPALSAAALALVLVHLALFGITREADEGAAARVFQLLIMAQAPLAAFFAIKWLPRAPSQTLCILALQAAAAFAPLALVFMLER